MKTVSDRTARSISLEQDTEDSKIKVSAGKQQYHASIEKGEREKGGIILELSRIASTAVPTQALAG
jgi:hypothetical protein